MAGDGDEGDWAWKAASIWSAFPASAETKGVAVSASDDEPNEGAGVVVAVVVVVVVNVVVSIPRHHSDGAIA